MAEQRDLAAARRYVFDPVQATIGAAQIAEIDAGRREGFGAQRRGP
jgi:hypothetical protein